MNPTVALLIGVILIGVVASGRARAVWDAITGNAPASSNTPGMTPGTGSGNVPGGNSGSQNPPGWA